MKTLADIFARASGALPGAVAGLFAFALLGGPLTPAPAEAAGEESTILLPGFGLSDEVVNQRIEPRALHKPNLMPEMSFQIADIGLSGFLMVDEVEDNILVDGFQPVTGLVGDATFKFQFGQNFALSTSVKRQIADLENIESVIKFRESVGGALTYYVTPRFELTAGGSIVSTDLSKGVKFDDFGTLPGEASVNATFHFLPFLSGSVNYTYEIHDPLLTSTGVPVDESTVSFQLIGRF